MKLKADLLRTYAELKLKIDDLLPVLKEIEKLEKDPSKSIAN